MSELLEMIGLLKLHAERFQILVMCQIAADFPLQGPTRRKSGGGGGKEQRTALLCVCVQWSLSRIDLLTIWVKTWWAGERWLATVVWWLLWSSCAASNKVAFLADLNREDQGTGEAPLGVDEPEQRSVQPPLSGDAVRKRKGPRGKLSLLLRSSCWFMVNFDWVTLSVPVPQLQGRLQQQSEQLRQELESAHRRSSQQLQGRLTELESSCKELTERKYKNEATIRDLKVKLVAAEEVSWPRAWRWRKLSWGLASGLQVEQSPFLTPVFRRANVWSSRFSLWGGRTARWTRSSMRRSAWWTSCRWRLRFWSRRSTIKNSWCVAPERSWRPRSSRRQDRSIFSRRSNGVQP